jgi:hypothetical protein
LLGAVLGAIGASGCIANNHPLSLQGGVEIFLDNENPIYAADLLDADGRAVLPRQQPFEKPVKLLLSDAKESDEGAYVDVAMDPPESLRLVPVDDTCEQLSGAFRCTAASDGYVNFIARSENDWSGAAAVKIVGRSETKTITVNPAGLPADTSGFGMIVGEAGEQITYVPASFTRLQCVQGPVPPNPFERWPVGLVRSRPAILRASPPPKTPAVVEHAPVIVESLYSEAMLSLDQTCPEAGRDSRIRVQLDANGQSPTFYLCFSDIGGESVKVVFRSGELVNEDAFSLTLKVDPEPRLLHVVGLFKDVLVDLQPIAVAEVTAYDANLNLVAMQVDVESTDKLVLAPTQPTLQLSNNPDSLSNVWAYAKQSGEAVLQVTPRLLSSPLCPTDTITVQ